MFMFRSKKTNLTRSLVKARKRRGNEARRSTEEETESSVSNYLKKLQANQLEMLLRAINSRGQDLSNCVLLPRESQSEEPHVLFCQTWRWPDLRKGSELRRLPMCTRDLVYDCCNPYHWSRVLQPEIPPPPYSRIDVDRVKPEERAPREVPLVCRDSYPGSITTNGDSVNPQEWCRLAYWELSKRVGPFFPVEHPAVNIFGKVSHPDGLSLETLAQHSFSPPRSAVVEKARCKIGLGVTLSREDDCVWVYNRSDNPIFVNSLTLEDSDYPLPTRVPAEHCLCVYDPVKAAQQNYGWDFTHPHIGPVDRNSIRISFVKGWGQNYSRREITSCPCWLEILLAPCR